ncbi:Uma2 family endonuclease [Saccharopolyspora spinosporotrichia]
MEIVAERGDIGGMSTMSWPGHLLTLEEFDQLPEDNSRRYELQEGVLLVTPKAATLHQRVVRALGSVLVAQLPAEWEAVPDVEVVLKHKWPPTVRIPDVLIAPTELIDKNPNRLQAADVAVAVEVISPGSRQMDQVTKRYEYAAAGIQGYWVLETDDVVKLTASRLIGEVYEVDFCGGGMFKTAHPFELTLDLDTLIKRA